MAPGVVSVSRWYAKERELMNDNLTDAQRRELKAALEAESQQLRDEIREELLAADAHRYEEMADRVRDPGDAAVTDVLADLEYAEIDRHIRALQANESALRRLSEGSYGLCVDCGEAIAVERLRAYPSAARCLDCQSARERQEGAPPRL